MPTIPTIALNDGTDFPELGLGTYNLRGDDGVSAIVAAISSGYRLLDTAVNYENEREVGEAVRRAGDELGVDARRTAGHDEDPGPPPRLRRGVRQCRGIPRRAGARAHRPAPHPLAEPERRQVRRDLAGDDRPARGRAGRLDRRLELHRGDAHQADRRDRSHARGQPGRAAPVLPAGRAARVPSRARHPHRELEPARAPQRAAHRAGRERRRRRPRGQRDAGRAALARPARARRPSRSRRRPSVRSRTPTSSASSCQTPRWRRSPALERGRLWDGDPNTHEEM